MDTTRCYKFRIDPTPDQERSFVQFAGCRRYAWNWALSRKREVYKSTGKGIGYNALAAELVKLKKTDAAFLTDCHSQVLQQTLMDLDKAFKAFFEKRARFPRLKSRKRSPHAFRIPQNVSVVDGRVSVPKVGLVKARIHRPMEGTIKSATIKSATIKQETDSHWYVVFVSHIELPDFPPSCDQPCGIDVGLSSFLTLDNGTKVEPPQFYRKGQRKLKRLQRKLSRCQKGSKNRAKAKARVARQHHKTASRRNDFLHKLSHGLVTRYAALCLEDLNLSALVRTKLRGHSKSWTDAALGNFLRMLDYKSLWNGGQVVKVGRWFPSSKTCHACQNIQPLDLSDRQWTCIQCSVVHDRDHNAAVNILSEGLRIVAHGRCATQTASGESVRLVTTSSLR